MLNEFDKNKDGKVKTNELPEDFERHTKDIDLNSDGYITVEEMVDFDLEKLQFSNKIEIQEQVDEIFQELNVKNVIEIKSLEKQQQGRFSAFDINQDMKITKKEAINFMVINNTTATFNVEGKTAFMEGILTRSFPSAILQLIYEHPNVDTIEMTIVPGSIDDNANVRAALYAHKFGLITKLNSKSMIASGGTDFFLCGKKRIVEDGAKIGVHSWSGYENDAGEFADIPANEVPRDALVHKLYLDYYNAIDIPEDFYWYTLEAPADELHIMTKEEIERYRVRKE